MPAERNFGLGAFHFGLRRYLGRYLSALEMFRGYSSLYTRERFDEQRLAGRGFWAFNQKMAWLPCSGFALAISPRYLEDILKISLCSADNSTGVNERYEGSPLDSRRFSALCLVGSKSSDSAVDILYKVVGRKFDFSVMQYVLKTDSIIYYSSAGRSALFRSASNPPQEKDAASVILRYL